MNQSEFLAFICILLKGREKLCVQGAIIFGLASHWLKNWREISKPIAKRGNRSRVVTELSTHVWKVLVSTKWKVSPDSVGFVPF